jgi:hypothetical protein
MKAQSEKLSTYFNQELIDGAKLAAINSNEWKLLLDKAIAAGEIDGAKALAAEGTKIWHTLSDRLSAVAPVAATFEAPITVFLVTDVSEKVAACFEAFDKAESALSAGGTQAEINECFELRRLYRESLNVCDALKDFRLLCGVVNAGIKAAQKRACDLARQTSCMAQKGAMEKKARDAICTMIKRDLEKYGLKVVLQTVEASHIDVKLQVVETDAQKAEKAIMAAFKLDPTAAIAAILKLDSTTRATIKNAILRLETKAAKNTAKEDTEHKQGAVETLADKAGGVNPDTGKPNVTDLVTLANASDQSALSEKRLNALLGDIDAQGTTPEQLLNLKKSASRGRKTVGV